MAAKKGWALKWRSENRLDGKHEYLMWSHFPTIGENGLFATRQEARDYNKKHYSYIKRSPDLRAEPHGWKMPQVVKASLTLVERGD